MIYNRLTDQEKEIIEEKKTEKPFSGKYDNFFQEGTYICKKCNNPLFSSKSKFYAGCGWPSFDASLPNSVLRILDPDGLRIEIVCANCKGHLGHVFEGERMTDKNTRNCVNSLSIKFIPEKEKLPKVLQKK